MQLTLQIKAEGEADHHQVDAWLLIPLSLSLPPLAKLGGSGHGGKLRSLHLFVFILANVNSPSAHAVGSCVLTDSVFIH